MAAPYECNVSCTDDETFVLTLELLRSDGQPFEIADYAFEYVLKGCGANYLLTEADGISVDVPTTTLTISPGVDVRLSAGIYDHGLRKKHIASGQVDSVFDGQITSTEGNF